MLRKHLYIHMGNNLPSHQFLNVGTNASIQLRRDQVHSLKEGKFEKLIMSYYVYSIIVQPLLDRDIVWQER